MKIQINANDVDQALALLAEAGIEVKTTRVVTVTKGQKILDAMAECIEKGEFKTRKQIADEVGCTQSRITEIVKTHAETDVVKGYHLLDASTKAVRLQEAKRAKLLKQQAEVQAKLDEMADVA